MEDGHFEDWVQQAESELLDSSTPNPRTGLIILRVFRRWHASEWEPHNRREEEFREKIHRYLWGLRFAVGAVAAMGGAMAWALSTVLDALSLVRAGGFGP